MARIIEEDLQQARQMDLLTYLQTRNPSELVQLGKDNYCTREHDSLKISNGKWYWFSRRIGGKTALDYLVKVRNYTFTEAVEEILGRAPRRDDERKLLLPEIDVDCSLVKQYLQGRGIHDVIIDYCVQNKLLFQTSKYHNALFVGYDEQGIPRYGALRGIGTSKYKGEVTGSDKRYSFSIVEKREMDTVHVFESAIDLLSHATQELYDGRRWKQDALLSLAGVFQTKRPDVVPVALERFLEQHPQIHKVCLHLDNDEVGRGAAAAIIKGLSNKYEVCDEPPKDGKDVNESLQIRVGLMPKREEYER